MVFCTQQVQKNGDYVPSLNRYKPSLRIIAENFLKIVISAEIKAPFIRTGSENRWTKSFYDLFILRYKTRKLIKLTESCTILTNQINMVTKQRNKTNSKHYRDKKQKQDVKFTCIFQSALKLRLLSSF